MKGVVKTIILRRLQKMYKWCRRDMAG